ncbi:MAG: hypothetical protein ACRCV3_02020 [Desulfovibrionaceae bacterium]
MGNPIRNNRAGGAVFLMEHLLSQKPSQKEGVLQEEGVLTSKAVKLLSKETNLLPSAFEGTTWGDLSVEHLSLLYKAFSSRSLYTSSSNALRQNSLSFTSKWKNLPKFLGASTAKMKKYSGASDNVARLLKNYYAEQPSADLPLMNTLIDAYMGNMKGSRICSLKDACNIANVMDSVLALSLSVKESNKIRADEPSNVGALGKEDLLRMDLYRKLQEIVQAAEKYPRALVKFCDKIAKYLSSSHSPLMGANLSTLEADFVPNSILSAATSSKYCTSLLEKSDDSASLKRALRKTHYAQAVLSTFDSSTFSGSIIQKTAIVGALATAPLMLGAFPVFSGLYFTISVPGAVTAAINAGLVSGFTAGMATSATVAGAGGASTLLAGFKKRWSGGRKDLRRTPCSRLRNRWGYTSNSADRIFKEARGDESLRHRTVSDMSNTGIVSFLTSVIRHRVDSILEDPSASHEEKVDELLKVGEMQLNKPEVLRYLTLQGNLCRSLLEGAQGNLEQDLASLLSEENMGIYSNTVEEIQAGRENTQSLRGQNAALVTVLLLLFLRSRVSSCYGSDSILTTNGIILSLIEKIVQGTRSRSGSRHSVDLVPLQRIVSATQVEDNSSEEEVQYDSTEF